MLCHLWLFTVMLSAEPLGLKVRFDLFGWIRENPKIVFFLLTANFSKYFQKPIVSPRFFESRTLSGSEEETEKKTNYYYSFRLSLVIKEKNEQASSYWSTKLLMIITGCQRLTKTKRVWLKNNESKNTWLLCPVIIALHLIKVV